MSSQDANGDAKSKQRSPSRFPVATESSESTGALKPAERINSNVNLFGIPRKKKKILTPNRAVGE